MNYNDIVNLKKVCGVLTEQYVLDVIEENNKLKDKIKKLKQYERPRIDSSFLNNNINPEDYRTTKYDKWRLNFSTELTGLVVNFTEEYYIFKKNQFRNFREIFFDTNFCLIMDCFKKYFTIITNNKHWAKKITEVYLTSIALFLNENLNIEDDKKNLEECLLLTLDNIISEIIIFELD